ncbi:hypothetical protein AC579_6801 [Pseudocercospora musae]|uniref:Uncharacterized protein n=1 Tax=Pseudocercospora musae TaxID=113226 RepID=A0A139IQJ6_9PEZI|nr:hypothetical protein AC579_6801 [Pseudocercospora musae]
MERSSRSSSEAEWQSEKDNLLPESEHIPSSSYRPSNRSIALILFSIITTNLLTNLLTYHFTKTSILTSYSHDLPSTPRIYPSLDRTLHKTRFSNHILNHTSIYSAPPSPQVDKAWNELGVKDQIFLLPEQLGKEIGLDPRRHVLAPENTLGEGIGAGYGVFVQGSHDMHCLNEIRRALYFNKPYYLQFENSSLTPEWSRRSHIRK